MARKNMQNSWGNSLFSGAKSYGIIKHSIHFFIVSIVLVVISAGVLGAKGLNLGIDFKGGSEFTISETKITSQQLAIDAVRKIAPNDEPNVSNVGDNSIRVQTAKITDNNDVIKLRDELAKAYKVNVENVSNTSIGPTWGASVGLKSVQGLLVFLLFAAIFMTIYFRSWQMAVAGIVALIHDLVVTVGIYALVGWEITPASMIGFLTILGYSMYDTVVVFDKVRENTHNYTDQTRSTYGDLANLAVNQTLVRSINTSVVALLPIGSILFFGAFLMRAGTLRDIALALFVGMAIGAYSSIFLATPLEVSLRSFSKKIKEHNNRVKVAREELNAIAAESGEDIDGEHFVAKLLPGKHVGNYVKPKKRKK